MMIDDDANLEVFALFPASGAVRLIVPTLFPRNIKLLRPICYPPLFHPFPKTILWEI
jgi:hypothetical protein